MYKLKKKYKRVALVCAYCGKEFCRTPSQVRDKKNSFCSIACSNKKNGKDRDTRGWYVNGGYVMLHFSGLSDREKLMAEKIVQSSKRYKVIREHRLVYSLHIGRPVTKDEIIHHKDGNKQNNNISNLELLNRKEHTASHRRVNAEFGSIIQKNKELVMENMFLKLTIESMNLRKELAI